MRVLPGSIATVEIDFQRYHCGLLTWIPSRACGGDRPQIIDKPSGMSLWRSSACGKHWRAPRLKCLARKSAAVVIQ
jgi:hypothetical protein